MANQTQQHQTTQQQTASLPYFAPLLPWQTSLWQQMVNASLTANNRLPHALLASGMAGIGKRAFVWRWVAWQLCDNHRQSPDGACGQCESCHWLKAGNHPDLKILPTSSSPTFAVIAETAEQQKQIRKSSKTSKSAKKSTKTSQSKKPTAPKIKIDDIRAIQDFVNQGSSGVRICVFDHADTMTIASANALLKTLEEPRAGVQLILMTDKPSSLLPTIKSRVQQLPLNNIDPSQAFDYVSNTLIAHNINMQGNKPLKQLLQLSHNAPLQAVSIAQSKWYPLRELWLKTWMALANGSRTPTTASDYWQTQLELDEFITLTQVMLVDLQRLSCNLPIYQQDIDFNPLKAQNIANGQQIQQNIQRLQQSLQHIYLSKKQNVQDKLAYDMLMQSIANL